MNRITWPALLLALLAGCVPARRLVPVAQVSQAEPAPRGPSLAQPPTDYIPPPPPKPPPDPPARLPDPEPDRGARPSSAPAAGQSSHSTNPRSAAPTSNSRSPKPSPELPPAEPRPRRPAPKPAPAAPRGPDLTPDAEPTTDDRPRKRPAPRAIAEARLPAADPPQVQHGPTLLDSPETPAGERLYPPPAAERARTSAGPTVRIVNGKHLRLSFQVRSPGTDPIPVELWYTRDGKGWQRDDGPPQARSPYVMEVREEGVYGLSLVPCTSGGKGLAPQPGDAPQFWVSVDWTRPTVTVLGVEVDLRRKSIAVRWSAADDHLTLRPITLSYAEQTGGPYVPLATNLKNTGSYWGPLPPLMPPRFFLRVEASDQGGNVGEARTLTPVVLDATPSSNKVQVLGVDVNED